MAIAIRSTNKPIFRTLTSCTNSSHGKVDRRNKPPLIISTNPSKIDITTLSNLYLSCNHSPHRFPLSAGKIDAAKLSVAFNHSSVVVSVFASVNGGGVDDVEEREKGLFERILPPAMTLTLENSHSLRRFGIGRTIVQRIVRILLSKGIYDISALCSEKERLFFAACGFGDDFLGSTTMMYAKTAMSNSDNDQITIQAGRKLLVAPPFRQLKA